MAMDAKEHRDIYIAAAVGGLGLILVLLYLFGGTQASAAVPTNADGSPLPSTTATPPPDPSVYNYNIAPYNPAPGLTYAKPQSLQPLNGGGCCDDCGPSTGSQYFDPSVAQFTTLLGTGAG